MNLPDAPQKTDRRVLYTKMFLRESLLELMREKPISKITPTELCRRAGINRNTFYTHYKSTEDLLSSIEEELFVMVRGSLERLGSGLGIRALITEICVAIAKNFDLSRILFSENGDTHFLERLISLAHDQTMLAWRAAGIRADTALLETLYTFSVNGSVAVIRAWVREEMPQQPQAIAEQLEQLTYNGLNAFTK
ncbi:MAG: TetR/AcrR family transcriptional regulator C-terminal domain-containing protein [Christensenella sp.]|nr:TetR/AcrR family transcriptional regulator C-terminal domain-containing protein [Christensenella sp.]